MWHNELNGLANLALSLCILFVLPMLFAVFDIHQAADGLEETGRGLKQ